MNAIGFDKNIHPAIRFMPAGIGGDHAAAKGRNQVEDDRQKEKEQEPDGSFDRMPRG
jgi:hypothetical protein